MSKKRLIASIIDDDEDSSQPTPSCRNRTIDSVLNEDSISSRPSATCSCNRSVSDILNEELSTLNQIFSIYESSEDDLEDIPLATLLLPNEPLAESVQIGEAKAESVRNKLYEDFSI